MFTKGSVCCLFCFHYVQIMQLTHFTDLGLRVLMYLTHQHRESPVTIGEIAERFVVSRNHLVKVVHYMSQQGWLVTTRGKGGGLALSLPPEHYRLGEVIRDLEAIDSVVNCQGCHLQGRCHLQGFLGEACRAFIDTLNRYTLADAVKEQTGVAIALLHRSHTANAALAEP